MRTEPGQVYWVDLGISGKVRPMVVVSREDEDAPRALSLCAPITTSSRNSRYEVALASFTGGTEGFLGLGTRRLNR